MYSLANKLSNKKVLMKINTIIIRKTSLVLVSLSLFIASVVLPTYIGNHGTLPHAYGQTNAAMLNALAAHDINAAASNTAIANTSTSSATNTTEGLQIKRDVNYFDSSSGYLAYPSATAG